MRISLVTRFGALVLIATGGPGARADDKPDVAKELKKFQGDWTFESVEAGGKKLPAEPFKGRTVSFDGDKYSVQRGDKVEEAATLKLDPSKSPKTLDVTVTDGPNKGAIMLGIYEFNGDTLTVCFDPEGRKRPTEFKTADGSSVLVIHKRVKHASTEEHKCAGTDLRP